MSEMAIDNPNERVFDPKAEDSPILKIMPKEWERAKQALAEAQRSAAGQPDGDDVVRSLESSETLTAIDRHLAALVDKACLDKLVEKAEQLASLAEKEVQIQAKVNDDFDPETEALDELRAKLVKPGRSKVESVITTCRAVVDSTRWLVAADEDTLLRVHGGEELEPLSAAVESGLDQQYLRDVAEILLGKRDPRVELQAVLEDPAAGDMLEQRQNPVSMLAQALKILQQAGA